MEPNRSHTHLVDLREFAPDSPPAFVVDAADLRILSANGAASAAFGYEAAQLIGVPMSAFVVAPDELRIRDHIRAVGDPGGMSEPSLAATVVHADGSLGLSHLAVSVETPQAPIATVLVQVGAPGTDLEELRNGSSPDPGTAPWLVHQINQGLLAESNVGVALFHARTSRVVAANAAYARLAEGQHRHLARALTEGQPVAIGEVEAQGIEGVRAGRLGVYAGPETDVTKPGRYVVCGMGTGGNARTYFAVYLYPPDLPPVTKDPAMELAAVPGSRNAIGLLAAVVDDEWHIRLVPRYSRVLGTPKDLGESVLPLVHPGDLPVLLELGQRVRSGQLGVATMALETRGADGTWATIDVELTLVSGGDPAPWLAILYSPAPTGPVAPPSEDWEPLLLLTHPELSTREREVARALLSGYRVTTIARHLFLSPSTVRNHLSSMFHKVGVESQAELIERFHSLRDDPFP